MKPIRLAGLTAGLLTFFVFGGALFAQDAGGHDHDLDPDLVSPYRGEERQGIPTLSEEDIRQIESGEGWGLAKAAELNGVPGPAHLLEMADRGAIHLSAEQLQSIRSLHDDMKARAIPVGKRLIEQERELNQRFASGDLNETELRQLLAEIGKTRSELRFIHLSSHLKTLPVLSDHQVQLYNRLRGYRSPEAGSQSSDE